MSSVVFQRFQCRKGVYCVYLEAGPNVGRLFIMYVMKHMIHVGFWRKMQLYSLLFGLALIEM
jgi:hypothetical protein